MNRRTLIHNGFLAAGGLALGGLVGGCKTSVRSNNQYRSVLATPESQGVSSAAIIAFIEEAKACDFEWHSYVIRRHNKIIAQGWWDPYKPGNIHTLYSLSKSFTSTAVGLAIADGHISLTDKVVSFFPVHMPANPSQHLLDMTIEHLLTMNTGHDTDSFASVRSKYFLPWIPTFLEHPVPYPPGSKFLYDTGATFMLSAIVQKVVGEPIDEYLKTRLFDPLGIDRFDWQKSPEGICAGGFGLRVNTEAIARFGQTYLNQGRWNGKQIIPEFWVEAATSKQTESNPGSGEWSNGYGYQFWRCIQPGAYRGDGAYGQYCIVMPDQDMVVAVTSESWDMGRSMQILFDHLLSGISEIPLKSNPIEFTRLKAISQNLSIPVDKSNNDLNRAEYINHKKFKLLNNEFKINHIQFAISGSQIEWTSFGEGKEITIVAGVERWHISDDEVMSPFPVFFRTDHVSRIAASATWKDKEILQIELKMLDGIHGDRITFHFKGIEINISMLNSVAANDANARNQERRADIKGLAI